MGDASRLKDKLRQNIKGAGSSNSDRKMLEDVMGDMNNIQNLVNGVDMNLNDIQMDDLFEDNKN